MLTLDILVTVCLLYSLALFLIAFWAERRAARGRHFWLRSPIVYTLSLSVYCTGWTFYGAVGSAARNGLEYVTIYVGPSLVMFCWWFLLRKLVRIGKAQRITSIADLISSRYGKSASLGVIVTLLAVIATTPYIALQLQSLTLSIAAIGGETAAGPAVTGFWFATGLALFAILFGTRTIDANEKHFGVVSAIAVEAVVKLVALVTVGVFVVWGLNAGPGPTFAVLPESGPHEGVFGPRWVTLIFLSATAVICLPRMFQVMVVENADERHLATAAWAFPAYLLMISLFVLPIAVTGRALMPEGANPDLYVLTLPLSQGSEGIALLSFLGGFSAATSMVIVSAIALSTMISNHVVVPVWLAMDKSRTQTSGDVRSVVLMARRVSIGAILALGYLYFLITGGSAALASIGLISFAGVAQILPSLIGGIYWRGANRAGAMTGIGLGFALWAYTLLLPSFEGGFLLSSSAIASGPFGIASLRPQALFGEDFGDPLVHATFWSLSLNVIGFVTVSLLTRPRLLERVQGAQFVDAHRQGGTGAMVLPRSATSEDLFTLAQRILGTETAHRLFAEAARAQSKPAGLPEADDALIARIERELAGSVGAASAHAMVSQITRGGQISVDELIRMADETAQIVEYSQQLERQSKELAKTAGELRRANARLTEVGAQKDAFLSQVSHELRTPMTSIRSFAEILRERPDLDSGDVQRFVGIIHEESQRLTRLLDEILDLSFLESGKARLKVTDVALGAAVESAAISTEGLRAASGARLVVEPDGMETPVRADFDRLAQVIINLVTNAVKYGAREGGEIRIRAIVAPDQVALDIEDDGPGIAPGDWERVFEKFTRLGEVTLAGSAGLGLPISREIMRNLGGDLRIMPSTRGARFRILLRPAARSAA
ncbi:sodium:solute symporter [Halovulum dunhuangense]|uniref:histidine kinase n=1 Tax=Halovulum dunhuangense TaxID=1505036 RepID=A0A849L064_9RHOB|nr:ATP-binding protein [Halovulum dunhuangense]NNU79320.1 sodium:solute symporter [Halovulum dunhuangense]